MRNLSLKTQRSFVILMAFLSFFVGSVLLSSMYSMAASESRTITLRQGKADIVSMPDSVSDIMVANPAIVEVVALQPDKLYLVGLAVGDTNVIVLDAQGNTLSTLDVHVAMDTQTLQTSLKELFPTEDVKVSAVGTQIIVRGEVSNPEVSNKIQNVVAYYLASVFDGSAEKLTERATILLTVKGEQQVMLKVRLVEASRSIIRGLSVQTFLNGITTDTETGAWELREPGSQNGGPLAFSTSGGDALIAGSAAALEDVMLESTLFLKTGIDLFEYLGFTLKTLEKEGLVNILAEPNLTAVSGQEAGFLAGGEFPVPVGRDRDGNIIIEFKEFGASLSFRPIVLSDDRISLQMKTEVSSLDYSNDFGTEDLIIPGLKIRKASTTVEVPSGNTLMIAGILQSDTVKNLSGLPGIKDTPILGDLMSSDSFERQETELIVMVTPYLVKPFGHKGLDAQAQAKPAQPKKQERHPLERAFVANIQKTYGATATAPFMSEGGRYGYLVD